MQTSRMGTRGHDGRPRRGPGRHRLRTPHGPLSTRHSIRSAAWAVTTGGWPIPPSGLRGVLVRRSPLLVVCLAVFVDMAGFGIILPVLPFYAAQLGGSGVWVGA